MFPIFSICFVIFLLIWNYRIHKSNVQQQTLEDSFWEREREANLARRKDISKLDYITIPEHLIPANPETATEIEFASLQGQKMLNLTGLSNTDLKMEYGVQNLEELSAYDDTFTKFVRLLPEYAKELLAKDKLSEAKQLLEFGIEHKADSKAAFLQLAEIYKRLGQDDNIQHLILVAGEINSLSRFSIISALQELQAPAADSLENFTLQ